MTTIQDLARIAAGRLACCGSASGAQVIAVVASTPITLALILLKDWRGRQLQAGPLISISVATSPAIAYWAKLPA